jgi:hypothetical protein
LRGGNYFSNLSLAANDERVRKAVLTLPTDRFGTRSLTPKTVSRAIFLDGYMMTGNLAIVPGNETLSATNRPPSPSSITHGAQMDRFFSKKQPAAPHSLDEQVAQVKEILQEDGQVIPAKQVTEIDAARTAPPMTAETSESGIERTALPTRTAESRQVATSQAGKDVRAVPTLRTTRSRSVSTRRTPSPRQGSRAALARTVERSRPSSSSRISRSTPPPARRMTKLASASHPSAARAARVYLDSANRQLDKGNYTAAIASYKRAYQVDRNNTATKSRLERARRAMLAENKIIAERR